MSVNPVNPGVDFAPISVGSSERTYMVVVTQTVGKGYVTLAKDKLTAAGVLDILKQNGGGAKFTLPVYQIQKNGKKWGLAQAGVKLGNAFDALQRKCQMVSSGGNRWWFPARFLADFEKGWQDLKLLEQELVNELLANEQEARSLYEARLQAVLTQANAMEDYYRFAIEFPSADQLREGFKLSLKEGPIPIPSLVEMARLDPEMQRWMRQIRQTMSEDLPKTSAKLSKAIALFFSRLSEFDPANPTVQQTKYLSESWTSVKGLVELFDEMASESSVDPVRLLANKALEFSPVNPSYPADKSSLQARLQAIQADLIRQEWIQEPTSANIELSKWCGILTLEDRLKDLKQRINAVSDLDDEIEKERQLKELKVQCRSYSGILKGTAAQLLALVGLGDLEETSEATEIEESESQSLGTEAEEVEAVQELTIPQDVAIAGF